MTNTISIRKIPNLARIRQVYSGRPGCACGCRGRYYPNSETDIPTSKDLKMIKKVHKLFDTGIKEGKVYSWKNAKKELAVLDKGVNRTYTLYFKK